MKCFAHIVNPVIVPDTSDLKVAQPITFESMRIAKRFARGQVDVSLLTAQYEEDRSLVPADFTATPDLDRSVLDLGDFAQPRKLPLLRDILDRLYECVDAEYLIYTNVDIALMPNFYLAVNRLIDEGFDAFTINRRTISDHYSIPEELPLMWADVGRSHSGHDCFIFRKDAYPDYILGNVCLGSGGVGRALILNLASRAAHFREFQDKHLTFHIGNDKAWKNGKLSDYWLHNRSCVLQVVSELEQRYGSLARSEDCARYLQGLSGPSWGNRMSGKLKRFFKQSPN